MILAHYQTLYESSVAFGMRKALQSARDKDRMIKTIGQLEGECQESEEEIAKLDAQYDEIVRRDKEMEEREYNEHLEAVK